MKKIIVSGLMGLVVCSGLLSSSCLSDDKDVFEMQSAEGFIFQKFEDGKDLYMPYYMVGFSQQVESVAISASGNTLTGEITPNGYFYETSLTNTNVSLTSLSDRFSVEAVSKKSEKAKSELTAKVSSSSIMNELKVNNFAYDPETKKFTVEAQTVNNVGLYSVMMIPRDVYNVGNNHYYWISYIAPQPHVLSNEGGVIKYQVDNKAAQYDNWQVHAAVVGNRDSESANSLYVIQPLLQGTYNLSLNTFIPAAQ